MARRCSPLVDLLWAFVTASFVFIRSTPGLCENGAVEVLELPTAPCLRVLPELASERAIRLPSLDQRRREAIAKATQYYRALEITPWTFFPEFRRRENPMSKPKVKGLELRVENYMEWRGLIPVSDQEFWDEIIESLKLKSRRDRVIWRLNRGLRILKERREPARLPFSTGILSYRRKDSELSPDFIKEMAAEGAAFQSFRYEEIRPREIQNWIHLVSDPEIREELWMNHAFSPGERAELDSYLKLKGLTGEAEPILDLNTKNETEAKKTQKLEDLWDGTSPAGVLMKDLWTYLDAQWLSSFSRIFLPGVETQRNYQRFKDVPGEKELARRMAKWKWTVETYESRWQKFVPESLRPIMDEIIELNRGADSENEIRLRLLISFRRQKLVSEPIRWPRSWMVVRGSGVEPLAQGVVDEYSLEQRARNFSINQSFYSKLVRPWLKDSVLRTALDYDLIVPGKRERKILAKYYALRKRLDEIDPSSQPEPKSP